MRALLRLRVARHGFRWQSTVRPPPTVPRGLTTQERPSGIIDSTGRLLAPSSPPAGGARSPGVRAARKPRAAPVTNAIVELSDENVQELVVQAPVAVLVYAWAEWSEPCKSLTPRLERTVQGAGGAVRLAKLNVDSAPQLASALKVAEVPAIIAVLGGKVFGAIQGVAAEDASKLAEFLRAAMAAADAQGLLPGGEGDMLLQAEETVEDAFVSLDAGDAASALAGARPVLEMIQATRDKLASQLEAAAKTDTRAQHALATASMSGPLYDLDRLAARAAAAVGAYFPTRVYWSLFSIRTRPCLFSALSSCPHHGASELSWESGGCFSGCST
jgi:thioredoxin-like negative regulator of GroEL